MISNTEVEVIYTEDLFRHIMTASSSIATGTVAIILGSDFTLTMSSYYSNSYKWQHQAV